MSLIVDFRKCDESISKIYNPHQEVIGYHMMAIGMGEITEKNHLEVYARLVLLHASTLQYDENDEEHTQRSRETRSQGGARCRLVANTLKPLRKISKI